LTVRRPVIATASPLTAIVSASAESFTNGWFRSGDLGVLDAAGYLKLVGRKKEMYIRGGYNIYPVEVEVVLGEHPAIAQAAVVGIPDPVLGERGVAYVVPRDAAAPPDAQEVRAFVGRHIADYKIPDRVVVCADLPLTPGLKVDKAALVARATAPDPLRHVVS
jgi:acyl-CoA synthetase (AMP-forming)/AMP-acid ligase II